MRIMRGKVCVYRHLVDGQIFYIGKGVNHRPFAAWGRPDAWYSVVEAAGYYDVEIVAWFDTDAEACKAEKDEIKKHRPKTNQQRHDCEGLILRAISDALSWREEMARRKGEALDLSASLKRYRARRNLSIARAAAEIGITGAALWHIENSSRIPHERTVHRLKKRLLGILAE